MTSGEVPADPFCHDLIAATATLRAFAYTLTHDWTVADDLVQDTLYRAWAKRASFEVGTNLHGWLITILRNRFYSLRRRQRWEVGDPDGLFASRLKTSPEQHIRLDFEDCLSALQKIAVIDREALPLVSAEGLSYEEAAGSCGVPPGTIKSRVNRARRNLARALQMDSQDQIGPDDVARAAVQG
jgi:RNA polymerase sigma-70 factor (ECF subfamily)